MNIEKMIEAEYKDLIENRGTINTNYDRDIISFSTDCEYSIDEAVLKFHYVKLIIPIEKNPDYEPQTIFNCFTVFSKISDCNYLVEHFFKSKSKAARFIAKQVLDGLTYDNYDKLLLNRERFNKLLEQRLLPVYKSAYKIVINTLDKKISRFWDGKESQRLEYEQTKYLKSELRSLRCEINQITQQRCWDGKISESELYDRLENFEEKLDELQKLLEEREE